MYRVKESERAIYQAPSDRNLQSLKAVRVNLVLLWLKKVFAYRVLIGLQRKTGLSQGELRLPPTLHLVVEVVAVALVLARVRAPQVRILMINQP